MERLSARVAASDARSGSAEQGRRSHVKRKPSIRGMETPSPGGETAVAEIRPGCHRSVRLTGKRALSAVFLINGGRCAVRCGCAGAPVAKRPAVRISSSQSDLPHTDQGERSGSVADFDSPTVAVQTLDSGDSSVTIGPTLAPAAAQGPPVSGRGGDLPPPSRAGGSLGLAREKLNLGTVGLPQNVIDTIQCARASSTRSLYSCKWRVFEEWCEARRVVLFQCSVRDILCFLFSKVCLRPNPAFIPKVVESAYRCPTVELKAFHPPPFGSAEESRLNTLCPVRALRVYVNRTASFRGTDQLFLSWATPHKGKPLSRQRLSHWIVEAIVLAYRCRGMQPPAGLKAHSTRSMATSWALFKGIRVEDICAAASWASPHTFVRFYRLDVSSPSLAHAVLESGASGTG